MASAPHAHSDAFVQRVQIAKAAIKETTIDNISQVIVEKLPDFKAYCTSSSSGTASEVPSPDLPFILVDVREDRYMCSRTPSPPPSPPPPPCV